ncbi:MAG TPA: AAA family ATPase [Armatimonadota bacterium]|nr:AAA family ATPase [Armatimonadota bacterium]
MLTATRAFNLNARSAPLLPQVEELAPLYQWGVSPRQGQVIMIAGRSGSQKSGFAIFWTRKMRLPTLYMSGDMTAFEATSRLVGMETGEGIEAIEAGLEGPDRLRYEQSLEDVNITFSFGQPITFPGIEAELEAWVELHNCYPAIIVIDNLMDIDGCEADYSAQQEAMQILSGLARETGSTIIVIHHATDKSYEANSQPGYPPSRKEIKNGLSEKPQLTLTVALEPEYGELRIACVKQRSGRSDPSASDFIRLRAYPEITRFGPLRSSYH